MKIIQCIEYKFVFYTITLVLVLQSSFQLSSANAQSLKYISSTTTQFNFSIPAQSLQLALIDLAAVANLQLLFPLELTKSVKSNPVYGEMTASKALNTMLNGTKLRGEISLFGQIKVQALTPHVISHEDEQKINPQIVEHPVENIFVTAKLRHALTTSAKIKRQATNIIEAVTEEDIGKMPDENLAETLQRVPGVLIERREGEGSLVRVRGLDNNLLLLNGENFITGMELFQIEDDRSFEGSLENIPLEQLHRVEIYKTPQAHHIEGSIGATIDLISRSAFDFEDDFFSSDIKFDRGEHSKETKGSGFFVFSKNWHNKFALTSSLSLNQRVNSGESVRLFNRQEGNIHTNTDGMEFIAPSQSAEEARHQERKRLGNSIKLEYRASDKTEFDFEWFYLGTEIKTHRHEFRHSFAIPSDVPDANIDTRAPLNFYFRGSQNNQRSILSSGEITKTNASNITLKAKSELTDKWQVTAALQDLSSNMKQRTGRIRSEEGKYFSPRWVGDSEYNLPFSGRAVSPTGWGWVTVNDNGYDPQSFQYEASSRPSFSYTNPERWGDPSNLTFVDQHAFGANSDRKNYTGRLDTEFKSSSGSIAIKTGLRYSHKSDEFDQLRYLFNFSKTKGAASPNLYNENGDIRRHADFNRLDQPSPEEFTVGIREAIYYDLCGNGGLLEGKTCDINNDGEDDNLPIGPYAYNTQNILGIAAIAQRLRTSDTELLVGTLYGEGLSQAGFGTSPSFSPLATYNERSDRYQRVNDIFLSGNQAQSLLLPNLDIVTQNTGEWIDGIAPNTPVELLNAPLNSWQASEESSAIYSEFDLTDKSLRYHVNVGIRIVHSKVELAKSRINDKHIGWRLTSEGSAGSIPLITEQVDSSQEYWSYLPSTNIKWHFNDELTMRVSASKAIARPKLQDLGRGFTPNFWFTSRLPNETPDKLSGGSGGNATLNPYRIEQYDVALEYYFDGSNFLIANFFAKNIKNFIINTSELQFGSEYIDEGAQITTPKNSNFGQINGAELSLQKIWKSGFGINSNASYIDSKSDNSSLSRRRLPLPGVSKYNVNIIGFYENSQMSIRLAYGRRSEYLSPFTQTIEVPSINGEPSRLAIFHRPSKRWDARITWRPNSKFSAYLDLLNITKEAQSGYLEFPNIPAFYQQDESRIAAGIKINLF